MDIPGQDVQSSCATFHYFLHTHTLLDVFKCRKRRKRKYTKTLDVSVKKAQGVVGLVTHHKLLLVASHAGAPLGVLVSPDEQLDQSGDGSLLPQSTVVGWTKSQVADQTNRGLDRGKQVSWN